MDLEHFRKRDVFVVFKVSAPVLYSPLGDPDSGDPSSSCVNSHFQALGEGFVTIVHKYKSTLELLQS